MGAPGARDVAGGVLLAALLGWVALVGGPGTGGLVGLLAAMGGVYVLARLVTRWHDWVVPLAVVAGAAIVAVRGWDVLLSAPLGSPLDYSNATGAFFVQAAGAAVIVAVRSPLLVTRLAALALAAAFAYVPWGNGTDTAAVMVLGLLTVGVVQAGVLRSRAVVAAGAVVAAAVLGTTLLVGAAYSPDREGAVDRLVDATLTERRAVLWWEALDLVRDAPLQGVGVGRFREFSATASGDSDAAWAHHELLQLGAETGVPGLLLGLGLTAWLFWSLLARPGDAGTTAAGVALAAVAVHMSVDYVLHFPHVGLAAAAVAGAGPVRQRKLPLLP